MHEMSELGYNYRLTDIQCALGISQLKKLDRFLDKREEYVKLYDELLADLAPIIKTPHRISNEKIGWHLYALRIDFEALGIDRASFMAALKAEGVGSQVHYIPVHTQPYYQKRYGDLDFKGVHEYYKGTLSIPLYPTLTQNDIHHVCDVLKRIVA